MSIFTFCLGQEAWFGSITDKPRFLWVILVNLGVVVNGAILFLMDGKKLRNLVFSGLLIVFSLSFISQAVQVVQRAGRLIDVKGRLNEAIREKELLEKELAYKQSSEFVELEARNKLNMIKPGEEVYVKPRIVGDDLLGAGSESRLSESDGGLLERLFFAPAKAAIVSLFDKIKQILLLFQS